MEKHLENMSSPHMIKKILTDFLHDLQTLCATERTLLGAEKNTKKSINEKNQPVISR